MKSLPYSVPDLDVDLNIGLLLLVLYYLEKTSRGKLLLNNEKLLIFMYLIKNPVVLERLLADLGRQTVQLNDVERYSVGSIAVNLDPLFDNTWIKKLLQYASARSYIDAHYRKDDGFMFTLSERGTSAAEGLAGDYFGRIRQYLEKLKQVKSETNANLNKLLNNIFRD